MPGIHQPPRPGAARKKPAYCFHSASRFASGTMVPRSERTCSCLDSRHFGNPALAELTPAACEAMQIPDRPDVAYSSYASCRSLRSFLSGFALMAGHGEDSDGMVPCGLCRMGKISGERCALTISNCWAGVWPYPMHNLYRPFDHRQFLDQGCARSDSFGRR